MSRVGPMSGISPPEIGILNESMESRSGVSERPDSGLRYSSPWSSPASRSAHMGGKKDMRLTKRRAKGWAGGDRI